MRALLLAIGMLAAGGCATIAGSRQYVSIDTKVRGVEVRKSAGGELLGVTPFFLHLERESHHDFRLGFPGGAPLTSSIDCRYRIGYSLVGNIPLAALLMAGGTPIGGAVAYGATNGIDLLTGAAYECPSALRLPDPAGPPPAPAPECPRYVVAPPRDEDAKVSRLIATRYLERVAATKSCATFVDPDASDRIFRRYGIDETTGLSVVTFERQRLNEVGFRTRATHLVILETEPRALKIAVKPWVYDLHTLALAAGEELSIDLSGVDVAPRTGFVAFLGRHIRLLPNSVAYSVAQKTYDFESAGTTIVTGARSPLSFLPSILSNWTVAWMEHPDRYGPWAATFGVAPTLVASYGARLVDLTREDGRTDEVRLDMVHLIMLADATATGHTPVGAFSLSFGLGGGFAWHWRERAFRSWDPGLYAGASVAWTAFVSGNVFLRVSGRISQSLNPNIEEPDLTVRDFTTGAVTFGYMLPELRTWIRNRF